MAPPDFARRMNYALETLYFFLNGRYNKVSSNDRSIRAVIRDFIAAHPSATPSIRSGKLYETENARLLRRYFYEALDHSRAYYLRCPGYPEDLCIAAPDRGVEPVGDR